MNNLLLRKTLIFLLLAVTIQLANPRSIFSETHTYGGGLWGITANIPVQFNPNDLVFGVQFNSGRIFSSVECIPYPDSVDSSYPRYQKLVDMMADNTGWYNYLRKYVATKIAQKFSNPKITERNGKYFIDAKKDGIFYRYYISPISEPHNYYILERLWMPTNLVNSQEMKSSLAHFSKIYSSIKVSNREGQLILDELQGHLKLDWLGLIGKITNSLTNRKK